LHSTQDRQQDIRDALDGYQASFVAATERVKAGFANRIELEENRRLALQALTNSINLLKERNNAWIALYRAAGGGWQGNSQLATAAGNTTDRAIDHATVNKPQEQTDR
jgi:outer membrane protein TolC